MIIGFSQCLGSNSQSCPSWSVPHNISCALHHNNQDWAVSKWSCWGELQISETFCQLKVFNGFLPWMLFLLLRSEIKCEGDLEFCWSWCWGLFWELTNVAFLPLVLHLEETFQKILAEEIRDKSLWGPGRQMASKASFLLSNNSVKSWRLSYWSSHMPCFQWKRQV